MDGELSAEHFARLIVHLLLVLATLLTPVACIEENRPAIFLSPRNFNPHPHQTSFNPRARANRFQSLNTGPVVFPPSATPPEDNSITRNIVTIDNVDNNNYINIDDNGERSNSVEGRHPIDDHPYPKVAQKQRRKFAGRFNKYEDEDLDDQHHADHHHRQRINPRVYQALSNHAAKVLSRPPSRLGKDYTLSSLQQQEQPKNYEFSYKVLDHLTGDDFSHVQSQNAQATNGEYRVKLPDGRLQIVSYVADKDGYKADVKYTEDTGPVITNHHATPVPPTVLARNQNIPRPLPIQQNIATKLNSYDYFYEDYDKNTQYLQDNVGSILYGPVVPTQPSKLALDYNNYVTPTQNPVIYQNQAPVSPRVEIYNTNGNYISSTVTPYLYDHTKSYVVSSTARPLLGDYDGLYVSSTPSFGLVQNHRSNGQNYGK